MKMLECTAVACGVDYLTAGELYNIVKWESEDSCVILDDAGDPTFVYTPFSGHGDFQIVDVEYAVEHRGDVNDNSMGNLNIVPFKRGSF